jgi:putative chitinase
MATDKRLNKRLPERVRREDTPGIRIDSGPFIGIIKNNNDPTRGGRLQVWIPDMGGQEDDPNNWRTVYYASPFFGTTYQPDSSRNNKFSEVQHTYGFWAVTPDIGNQVICTFIAGDANRGYWFGCVNPNLSHSMVPAMGTSSNVDNDKTVDTLKSKYDSSTSKWPVAEFNENLPENIKAGWINNSRPVHEFQANILINQGLDRDGMRGAIGSSSQRESPSTVFGWSTPGRPLNDPADSPDFQAKLESGKLTDNDTAVRGRKGGHTFVMDDGDQVGKDQLVRLRTAGGHQILMNDTERVMYLANSDGSVWMEFTGGGHVNVFAAAGINLRTDGEFNLHARDINMHATGSINMKGEKAINNQTKSYNVKADSSYAVQSGKIGFLADGAMNIQSASGGWNSSGKLVLQGSKLLLNTETPPAVPAVGGIATVVHTDTGWDPTKGMWISQPQVFESIATIAPAHEPWTRGSGKAGRKQIAGGGGQFGAAPQPTKPTSVCAPPGEPPRPSVNNITPSGSDNESLVESALKGYGITDTTKFAAIMAQCAHESGNFRYLKELGGDSYFAKYEGRKDLGNTEPGDGLKFKGRGFIQITGRDLYTKAGSYLGQDLVGNPALAEDPTTAAKLVLYFFFEYKKGRTANVDWSDITAVTRIVNGGTNGLDDRKAKFAQYQQKYSGGIVISGSGAPVTTGDGSVITTGSSQLDPGPLAAKGKAVENPAPAETMSREDAPNPGAIASTQDKIPGLIATQVKALMIQIGHAESKLDYAAQDTAKGRLGRYMFNNNLLRDYGYIKPDYVKKYKEAAPFRDDSWTGKDSISSLNDFLSGKGTQESLMEKIVNDYYNALVSNQGISMGDDVCTVAGMIAVAYYFRDSERGFISGNPPDQAKYWREQKLNSGDGNVLGITPYNQGRYAVDVLSIASAASTSTTSLGTSGPPTVDINPDDVFTFSGQTGTRENFDACAVSFKDAILKAAKAYKEKTGKKINIMSAFRPAADQERIYNTWIQAGGHIPDHPTAAGITTPALPASMGGKVNAHGMGAAIDCGAQAAEVAQVIDLASFGLKWGGLFSTPDKVHIQLASYTPGGPAPT